MKAQQCAHPGRRAHPLPMRRIAARAVVAINVLSSGLVWHGNWCGRQWRVRMSVPSAPVGAPSDVLLAARWKAARVCLGLSGVAAERILAMYGGVLSWDDLTDELALALLQDAVDHLAVGEGESEDGTGSIRIRGRASPDEVVALPFALRIVVNDAMEEEALFSCEVLTDLRGLNKMARGGARWGSPPDLARWGALPIPVALELGWVDLPLTQLRGVRCRDVLLPDGWWSTADGASACLRISRRLGFVVDMTGEAVLQSRSRVRNMEQDISIEASADASASPPVGVNALGEVPVRVVFDLGDYSLTLNELASVAPGHVFDLGLVPERAVGLRINGFRIGEGELVEIDGRVGVAVTRMIPPGHEEH